MSHSDTNSPSVRPYLLRAWHEWCTDNGFAPYIAVYVDASVRVPPEHVRNNEIVLNVSLDATSELRLGNDLIQFKARFGGVAREVLVPVSHVIAVYARESGQGMAFSYPDSRSAGDGGTSTTSLEWSDPESSRRGGLRAVPETADDGAPGPLDDGPNKGGARRPHLKRVK